MGQQYEQYLLLYYSTVLLALLPSVFLRARFPM
jgi:hypothetical protein